MRNTGQFKKGLLYGVGIDDTDYPKERRVYSGNKSKVVWYCPVFSRWRNMLKRCYTNSDRAYKGVTVCPEWLFFSNYKAWYDSQIKPEAPFDVDKDLLQGRVRVYSPETCILLPRRINSFLSVPNKGLPGAYYERDRDKFQAYCRSLDGKREHLGRFTSEMDAHRAWQGHKILQVEALCDELYGDATLDPRIPTHLHKIKMKIEADMKLNRPTLDLKLEDL
ncbi:hypothetical protein ACPF8X_41370 [Streptomyces sp. G35A]